MHKPIFDGSPRFYGRRRGRALSAPLKWALEELYPQKAIINEMGKFTHPMSLERPLWLEIGFGSGENLLAMAKTHPQFDFIGAEPFLDGLARALRDSYQQEISNISFYNDDVRHLLAIMPPQSLDGVMILFPDPWPKRRHWSRRLINNEFLDLLHVALKPDGELHIASDHRYYITWILSHLMRRQDFLWQNNRTHHWLERPADWPLTRYEQKRLDGTPHHFTFTKK